MNKKGQLLNIITNLQLQHIGTLLIAMNNQLTLIMDIHHSNVINTVTTKDLLIMLLDGNFPMTSIDRNGFCSYHRQFSNKARNRRQGCIYYTTASSVTAINLQENY